MKNTPAPWIFVISIFLSGCAAVGVKVEKKSDGRLHREALAIAESNKDSESARLLAEYHRKKSPKAESALALVYLGAVESAAEAEPGTLGHQTHQAAMRGLIALMASRDFAELPLPDGRSLRVSGDTRTTLDPRTATTILPAQDVVISKLRVRTLQSGAGLPCVAHFAPESAALEGQPGVPKLAGLCEPVTALVRSDGKNPELVFHRTRIDDDALVDGRRVKLAADFSAPLAYMLSRGRNRNIDIGALIWSDKNFRHTGLFQFHRYDPGKIPVVFVHGLLSRPETWVPAVNELMADEKVRERYQFWFFLYPTGLPVWGSAAELRSELDRYRQALDPQRRNRNLDRMVLVGHSMGGLVSSLQVRSGGEALWGQFMQTPPEKLSLSPRLKERIVEVVEFQPRPDVSRVVFFATPHRGSNMAVHPAAEFFSRLVRVPINFIQADVRILQSVVRNEFRGLFTAPANSLVFLRANSPLLESILALPMRPGVPYHSIVGDQGKGNAPESSDGVVPYWSSRMDGAQSEKIVPSGHGAHEHPEGIEELRRILRLHLPPR
jgi:pimeloyl-ACP methyl ester carboxylesterase